MDPQREIFVKPSVTRWLAEEALAGLLPADTYYQPRISQGAYRGLRDMYYQLSEWLKEYEPVDLIDVQSFVFVAYALRDASDSPEAKAAAGGERQADKASQLEEEDSAAVPGPRLETRVPVHHDHPAEVDELNRSHFAAVLAERIRQTRQADKPPPRRMNSTQTKCRSFAVHLHGPWGSGKSSILNFLAEELKSDPQWLVVEFNAWRHQRFRPPWWPLIREVYEQSQASLGPGERIGPFFRWWWWRMKTSWLPVLLTLAAILLTFGFVAFLKGPGESNVGEAVTLALALLSLFGAVRTWHHSFLHGSSKAAQSYLELRSDPQGTLSKLFEGLVEDFGRPLAIFIDDLDRCDGDYTVDLLEGIQTLFREASAVYVVAADREWIRTSFEQRYGAFTPHVGSPGRPLGHLFLEKLFQISLGVPRLSEKVRGNYWNHLTTGAGEAPAEVAEEMVRRGNELLDGATSPSEIQQVVEEQMGTPEERSVRVAAARRLSTPEAAEETEHFLAPYATLLEPNPRSMKRLVNAFGLQQSTNLLAETDVPLDALARWTILEQRWPKLADLLEKHPAVIGLCGGEEPPDDRRIPERLRPLFVHDDLVRVVCGRDREQEPPLDEATVHLLTGRTASEAGAPTQAAENG